jgi:arylsulfatase
MKAKKGLLIASLALICAGAVQAQQKPAAETKRPNIVIIWGDDIGQSNISAYSHGLMGYKTPSSRNEAMV